MVMFTITILLKFLSAELIPKNKESLDKCLKNFPKKSSGSDIFGVVISGLWIIIDIKVINGNRFEISNLSVTEYDSMDIVQSCTKFCKNETFIF
jgi:hypothetical protein